VCEDPVFSFVLLLQQQSELCF